MHLAAPHIDTVQPVRDGWMLACLSRAATRWSATQPGIGQACTLLNWAFFTNIPGHMGYGMAAVVTTKHNAESCHNPSLQCLFMFILSLTSQYHHNTQYIQSVASQHSPPKQPSPPPRKSLGHPNTLSLKVTFLGSKSQVKGLAIHHGPSRRCSLQQLERDRCWEGP